MPRSERRSAEEWRETILEAAIIAFAERGYHGASTETIAQSVGISQPYIFRLFGSKKALFLAAAERVTDRIQTIFQNAVATEPANPLAAMGNAYRQLLSQRDELLLLLQAFAASSDPEIQTVVRKRFRCIYEYVEGLPGVTADHARHFMAMGMLLTVGAALDLPNVNDQESWAKRCLGAMG